MIARAVSGILQLFRSVIYLLKYRLIIRANLQTGVWFDNGSNTKSTQQHVALVQTEYIIGQ